MSALTAILYAALAIYLGGWYADRWIGNFSLLLFVLTVVTLAYWLAERFHFKPAREAAASALEAQMAQRRAELAGKGITQVDGDLQSAR
jgi:signal peptidase I